MTTTSLSGSCLCGAVRYEVSGEPKRFYHCHCSRCRKASGTGHATNLMVAPEALTWTAGEELVASFKLPEAERFRSCFCRHCGAPLPREVKEIGMVVIPAGSLDCEVPMQPQARIFYGSRTSWSCSGDALPVFEEVPPPA